MWPAAEPGARALVVLAALLLCTGVRAATGMLEGPLGRWLDDTVAPELAETLSRHPMFKGETVRFATLKAAVPQRDTTALNEAVERRLTQRLLQEDGVRLAVGSREQGCAVPRSADYVIGIEIAPAGGREVSVSLGIIDVAESVWVSGIAFQWQGPLSAAERQALNSPLATAPPGTAESPLPLADADAVAAALRSHLQCTLPGGLDGPVFLDNPEDAALTRIGLALQGRLLTSPLAAMTADPTGARWVMRLKRDSAGGQLQEIRVDLEDRDGGASQRVAAVFVAAVGATLQAGTAPATNSAAVPLLSPLTLRPAEAVGVCDSSQARVNSCAEVEFEVRETAYVLVFSTRAGSVEGLDCHKRPKRSEPGLRRYRLRVPPRTVPPVSSGALSSVGASRRPDAGLYVLATTSSRAASKLHAALRDAPGACRSGIANPHGWLQDLERLVSEQRTEVSWRAIHLAHETEGVVAL